MQRQDAKGKCVDRLVKCCSGWIMRASDTPEDAHIKRAMTPLAILMLFVVPYSAFYDGSNFSDEYAYSANSMFLMAGAVSFLVRGYIGADMRTSVDILIVVFSLGLVYINLRLAAEMRGSLFIYAVLLLDMALVFNTPRTIPFVIFVFLVFCLVLMFEASLRFGVYNAVETQEFPWICDCADPPCATTATVIPVGFIILAIPPLADFYLTRGFATNLRLQLRRVEASVLVAGEVTDALARYDVDAADRAIARGDDLPEELVQSYRLLLSNLLAYRDFLPETLLRYNDSEAQSPLGAKIPPPLADDEGDGKAAMAFTDIQSSTAL
eukprot:Hpha_TRINITY_DN15529_c9_g1::TRINITY_DN15529_c9_g1_i1::g.106007::m.106007